MKIVTAGQTFTDIDAYAGCIGYVELLRQTGEEAIAVLPGALNDSVPSMVRQWEADVAPSYLPGPDDEFILIDISDPEHLAEIVDRDRVVEVIDHHLGFIDYWKERIGDRADIEFIGAACTQVYERWLASGYLGSMDSTTAKLLICGILDNTLNFKAKITTDRDKRAYEALSAVADWSDELTTQYFSECQEQITSDLVQAIINDKKHMKFEIFAQTVTVGQLVVWDATRIVDESIDIIKQTLSTPGVRWFMNIVDISRGKSFIAADSPTAKQQLSRLLGMEFVGDVAEADRLWLRKEIKQRDMDSRTPAKYITERGHRLGGGYISLPDLELSGLPESIAIDGEILPVQPEHHITLLCAIELAEAVADSVADIEPTLQSIVKAFVEFESEHRLDNYDIGDNFYVVEDEDRKSLVVDCQVPNLDKLFDKLDEFYDYKFARQWPHITLYARYNEGIGISSSERFSELTRPIELDRSIGQIKTSRQ